jgi:hypothetical protein
VRYKDRRGAERFVGADTDDNYGAQPPAHTVTAGLQRTASVRRVRRIRLIIRSFRLEAGLMQINAAF